MEQLITCNIGQKKVRPAVVVVIADDDAHSIACSGYACFVGNIGKGAIMIVMEETVPIERRFLFQRGDGCPSYQVDIQISIEVVVEQRYAADHRLDLIFIWRRRVLSHIMQTGLGGDLFKSNLRFAGTRVLACCT